MKPLYQLIATSWVFLLASSNCVAHENATCSGTLSVTEKPSFEGLGSTQLNMDPVQSSEGGEIEVFTDRIGQPVYVLVSEYGETGKRVSLYKPAAGEADSFAVRVSEYNYVEPVYVGGVRIASVETDSFIVSEGSLLRGVGSSIDKNVVANSIRRIEGAMKAFVARKPAQ
ncbi:MAG TPA: hypothetical protein VFK18_02475 [Luteimonas sp.]|nr:hypothetical protein [Luteimonas sp.]